MFRVIPVGHALLVTRKFGVPQEGGGNGGGDGGGGGEDGQLALASVISVKDRVCEMVLHQLLHVRPVVPVGGVTACESTLPRLQQPTPGTPPVCRCDAAVALGSLQPMIHLFVTCVPQSAS